MKTRLSDRTSWGPLLTGALAALILICSQPVGGCGDSRKGVDSAEAMVANVAHADSSPQGTNRAGHTSSVQRWDICDSVKAAKAGSPNAFTSGWLVNDVLDDSCSFELLSQALSRIVGKGDTLALSWLVAVGNRSDGALADAMTDYLFRAFMARPVEMSMRLAALPDTMVTALTYDGARDAIDTTSLEHVSRDQFAALRSHAHDPGISKSAARILVYIIEQGLATRRIE